MAWPAVLLLLVQGGSWTTVSTTGGPQNRSQCPVVWTGQEFLLWGGYEDSGTGMASVDTGYRYNPTTDTWTAMSGAGAPPARFGHAAFWTGSRLIVWGGMEQSGLGVNTGALYDPATDSWTPMTTTNAPVGRTGFMSVWTGSEMIVWGGSGPAGLPSCLDDGGRYDPAGDTWTATGTTGNPLGRDGSTAVWTGQEMLIWGGFEAVPGHPDLANAATAGVRYHPVNDAWTPMSTTNFPALRDLHTAVWTGSEMIVWGGHDYGSGTLSGTGARYNPASDVWTPVTTAGAPSARRQHGAVMLGAFMAVWGGDNGVDFLSSGGLYDPATNQWASITESGAPSGRSLMLAGSTGTNLFVFGGENDAATPGGGLESALRTLMPELLGDGHLYDPTGARFGLVSGGGGGGGGCGSLGLEVLLVLAMFRASRRLRA